MRIGLRLAAAAAVVLTAMPATAQEAGETATGTLRAKSVTFTPTWAPVARTAATAAAPQAPAPKKVTVTAGADFPTLYIFRGIVQENDANFTMQPFVDVGFAASPTVTVNGGSWNSFNSGDMGSGNPLLDGMWLESDIYGSMTFTAGKWKPGVLYTAYTYPNNAYNAVQELAGVVSFDDSASKVPVSPKIIVAFELSDASADGGDGKGIYLELGMKPAVKAGSKVTIGFPVQMGLSLKDYYESGGEDHGFGFFRFGANASVPLSQLKMGGWEFRGGVDFWCFSEARAAQTAGQSSPSQFRPVGSLGFSVVF